MISLPVPPMAIAPLRVVCQRCCTPLLNLHVVLIILSRMKPSGFYTHTHGPRRAHTHPPTHPPMHTRRETDRHTQRDRQKHTQRHAHTDTDMDRGTHASFLASMSSPACQACSTTASSPALWGAAGPNLMPDRIPSNFKKEHKMPSRRM